MTDGELASALEGVLEGKAGDSLEAPAPAAATAAPREGGAQGEAAARQSLLDGQKTLQKEFEALAGRVRVGLDEGHAPAPSAPEQLNGPSQGLGPPADLPLPAPDHPGVPQGPGPGESLLSGGPSVASAATEAVRGFARATTTILRGASEWATVGLHGAITRLENIPDRQKVAGGAVLGLGAAALLALGLWRGSSDGASSGQAAPGDGRGAGSDSPAGSAAAPPPPPVPLPPVAQQGGEGPVLWQRREGVAAGPSGRSFPAAREGASGSESPAPQGPQVDHWRVPLSSLDSKEASASPTRDAAADAGGERGDVEALFWGCVCTSPTPQPGSGPLSYSSKPPLHDRYIAQWWMKGS